MIYREWYFVQSVTPSVGPLFAPLEAASRGYFLPDLLGVTGEEVTNSLNNRITWGVKRAGIGISDPTHTVPANFETS